MAAQLTAAQIITAVKGENGFNDATIPDATIMEAANDFTNEVFTEHKIKRMEATEEFSISTGDFETQTPSTFLTIQGLSLQQNDSNSIDITRNGMSWNEFLNRYPNYQTANPGMPLFWTTVGRNINFNVPSNGNYDLTIKGIREPKQMVLSSDYSEFSILYREMVKLGAMVRIMMAREDYDEANELRDKLDPKVVGFVAREGRGQFRAGPRVMKSSWRGTRSRDW